MPLCWFVVLFCLLGVCPCCLCLFLFLWRRAQMAARRFVDTEAGEEDELGDLRKNLDGDDDAAVRYVGQCLLLFFFFFFFHFVCWSVVPDSCVFAVTPLMPTAGCP